MNDLRRAIVRVIGGLLMIMATFLGAGAWAETGESMLMEAASSGNAERVRELLAAGVPVDMRDADGPTALLLATRANHPEVAKVLIAAGANVNAKDANKDTPFLYAGAEGRNEILQAILATGKADLGDTNRYGGTALIPAAHHGHPDTVRILLATDINVNHVNNLGWTALLEAVILGDGGPVYQEIVGLLVEAGAKNIADRDGKTPLDHARASGYAEIAERIEAGGRK